MTATFELWDSIFDGKLITAMIDLERRGLIEMRVVEGGPTSLGTVQLAMTEAGKEALAGAGQHNAGVADISRLHMEAIEAGEVKPLS